MKSRDRIAIAVWLWVVSTVAMVGLWWLHNKGLPGVVAAAGLASLVFVVIVLALVELTIRLAELVEEVFPPDDDGT